MCVQGYMSCIMYPFRGCTLLSSQAPITISKSNLTTVEVMSSSILSRYSSVIIYNSEKLVPHM